MHPYDPNTGNYSHVGASLGGAALRFGAGYLGGPIGAGIAGRLENKWAAGHYAPSQPATQQPAM